MPQILNLDTKGIKSFQSPYNESQSAMKDALNVVVDKDNCIESRRGYDKFNDIVTADGSCTGLFYFDDSVFVVKNNKLYYDNSGTWVEKTGTFTQPPNVNRIRTIKSKGNAYFTSSIGVGKLENKTNTVRMSGVPRGLNGSGVISSTSGARGWFTPNTQVAYRIVWGYKDANNNILLGSPSDRIEVTNPLVGEVDWSRSGTTVTFQSTAHGLVDGDLIKVTASEDTAGLPLGDYVITKLTNDTFSVAVLVSGTISSKKATYGNYKYCTVTFNIPNEITTAYFYQIYRSNVSAGIQFVGNDEMGLVFEGNPTSGEIIAQEKSYPDVTPSTLLGDTIYTAPSVTQNGILDGNEEPPMCNDMCEYKGNVLYAGTKTKHKAYVSLITTGGTSGIVIDSTITIGGVVYTAKSAEAYLSAQFKVYTGGSISEDIRNTAISLVNVVNKYSLSTVSAYYVSGYNDIPGKLLFIGTFADDFTVASSKPDSFSPSLTTALSATNDDVPNRVYISKYQQPEAVPVLNYIDIGTKNSQIDRIIALRDSVMVFLDIGEIYTITGESAETFNVRVFDNATKLECKDSAVVTNNAIYCMTDSSIVAISDNGISIAGRDIEDQIRPLLSNTLYPNFRSTAYGIGYETERLYIFNCIKEYEDTYCTQSYVLNTLTGAWTRWEYNSDFGIINTNDDLIYYCNSEGQVYSERKSRDTTDYATEYGDITIDTVTQDYITVDDATGIEIGDGINQSGVYDYVSDIDGLNLYLISIPAFTTGAATLYKPVRAQIEWLPQFGQNPSNIKVWQEMTLYFRELESKTIDVEFSSSYNQVAETIELNRLDQYSWGSLGFGSIPWGASYTGQQQIRTFIPYSFMKASWLKIKARINNAFTKMSIYGCSLIVEQVGSKER